MRTEEHRGLRKSDESSRKKWQRTGKSHNKKKTTLKISIAYKTYYFSHLRGQINPKPDQKKKKVSPRYIAKLKISKDKEKIIKPVREERQKCTKKLELD